MEYILRHVPLFDNEKMQQTFRIDKKNCKKTKHYKFLCMSLLDINNQ